MSTPINRRTFLQTTAATGLALGAAASSAPAQQKESANEKLVVGVMGCGGRGRSLAPSYEKTPNCDVKYVCDVDSGRASQGAKLVNAVNGRTPIPVTDFRQILDDKDVDILVVATPNHWHAPAAILGCKAGKHVYVEKPCCHNPREGEMMVEAARKYKRVVQMGNQRRSWDKIIEGVELVRSGELGRALYSRAWYGNTRPSIGHGTPGDPPANLNYDLWQGPAPRKPYHSNYLHYNWHWFWHWGNGEIGNNGIHALDLSRWGLDVTYPIRVSANGGRYFYDDDQETPDTHVVSYDFPEGKSIMWEGQSCNRRGPEGNGFGASFHCEKGTVVLDSSGYILYSATNREEKKVPGGGGNAEHINDFLATIRKLEGGDANARSHSDIEGGYQSTLLCHLGNISYRMRRSLNCDPKNGHILDDKEAMGLWSREYEPGWEPKV